jgi:hypothetical protein
MRSCKLEAMQIRQHLSEFGHHGIGAQVRLRDTITSSRFDEAEVCERPGRPQVTAMCSKLV